MIDHALSEPTQTPTQTYRNPWLFRKGDPRTIELSNRGCIAKTAKLLCPDTPAIILAPIGSRANPYPAMPSGPTDPDLVASHEQLRNHLKRIDAMLAVETDALAIDRLSRARGSLSEQERILAGRPLPGMLRQDKPTGRRTIQMQITPANASDRQATPPVPTTSVEAAIDTAIDTATVTTEGTPLSPTGPVPATPGGTPAAAPPGR